MGVIINAFAFAAKKFDKWFSFFDFSHIFNLKIIKYFESSRG